MNPWWIVFTFITALWVVPMAQARHAGFPWWFFVGLAALWFAMAAALEPLYDTGVRLRKALGMKRLAEWGERNKGRTLPPARFALIAMALITLAAGFL